MKHTTNLIVIILSIGLLLSLACTIGRSAATAIPAGRPIDFEVQTATPTSDPALATEEPLEPEAEAEAAVVIPLADAPTDTPDPDAFVVASPTPALEATPTSASLITATITTTADEITETEALTLTGTTAVTATEPAPTRPPQTASGDIGEPLRGGEWDFEGDFVAWPNPYGEPCPGAAVAAGWTAFVEEGEYGSSCMNENLYGPNVFSGLKSQEITFDFIAANSGVYRTIPTQPGHRYNIVAYAKHDFSIAPVQFFLGVDLTGGTEWSAETVEWFPWDSETEDTWGETEETVTATGETMTLFLRGFHPAADQGGKSVLDNVSVTDLGP